MTPARVRSRKRTYSLRSLNAELTVKRHEKIVAIAKCITCFESCQGSVAIPQGENLRDPPMLELVDCEIPPAVEIAPVEIDEIAEIIDDIRNIYCKRCLQFTGEALDEAEMHADRRIEPRDSITIPFYLRPARGDSEIPPIDRSRDLIAVTRDLTHRGIGFQCDEPLDERFYIAEFDGATADQVRLLIEIRWRRQKSSHHFVAGCRILCPLYK